MKNLELEPITKCIVMMACRLESIANKHIFEPMGLSSTSVKIMHVLLALGPQSPTQLLDKLGGTKSNVSQRLNFLEKKGYTERTYGCKKEDKRQVAVQLTKVGQKKLKEIAEIFKTKSMDNLESCFGKAELKSHFAFFAKLNNILDEFEIQMGKCPNQLF